LSILKCVRELKGVDRTGDWEKSAIRWETGKLTYKAFFCVLLYGADLGDWKVRFHWSGILTGDSSSSLPRFCGLVSNWTIVSQSLGGGGGNIGEGRKMDHAFPL